MFAWISALRLGFWLIINNTEKIYSHCLYAVHSGICLAWAQWCSTISIKSFKFELINGINPLADEQHFNAPQNLTSSPLEFTLYILFRMQNIEVN